MTARHGKAATAARAGRHALDPRTATVRLIASVAIGAAAWLAIPAELPLAVRLLATWSISALALLAFAAWIIVRSDTAETARRAAAYDPGRTVVWILVLAASGFSLFGAIVVARGAGLGVLALCVASVAVSWLVTHAGFTLRYARLYYRIGPGDPEGGIELPGGERPDDLDFAYFAFTIGMCFQVSDATISNRIIRRTALAHAVISFAYNTVIIALALNLVVGHLG